MAASGMNPFLSAFVSPDQQSSSSSTPSYKPSGSFGGRQFKFRGVTRSPVINPNVSGDAPWSVLFQVIDFPGDGGIVKSGANDRFVDGGVSYVVCPAEKKKPLPGSAEAKAAADEAAKMAAEGKTGKKPRQLREIRRDKCDTLSIGSVITVCFDKKLITAEMRQKRKLDKGRQNADVFESGLVFDIGILEALYEEWKDKKTGETRSAIRYYAKEMTYVCQTELLPGPAQDLLLFSILEGGQHNPRMVPLVLNPHYDFSAKRLLDCRAPEQSLTAKQIREAGPIALVRESLKMVNAGEFEVPFTPSEYLPYYSHLAGGADGKGKHAKKVLFWRTPYCPLSDGAYWTYTKDNETHPKFSFATSVVQMVWDQNKAYNSRTFNAKHCLMGAQLDYLGICDDEKRISVLPVLAVRTPALIRSFVSSDTAMRSVPEDMPPEISFGASCKADSPKNQTVLCDSVVGILNAGFRVPYETVARVMKDLAVKHKGRYALDMGTAGKNRPSKSSCFVDRDVVSQVFNVLECQENLEERARDCAFFAVMTVGIKSNNSESMQLIEKWTTEGKTREADTDGAMLVMLSLGQVFEALYFGTAFPDEDSKRAFSTANTKFDFVLFGVNNALLKERGLDKYFGCQAEIDVILPRVLARREAILAAANVAVAASQDQVNAALGVANADEAKALLEAMDADDTEFQVTEAAKAQALLEAMDADDTEFQAAEAAKSKALADANVASVVVSTEETMLEPSTPTAQRTVGTPDRKAPGAPKPKRQARDSDVDTGESAPAAVAASVYTPKPKKNRRRVLDMEPVTNEDGDGAVVPPFPSSPSFNDEGDGSSLAY